MNLIALKKVTEQAEFELINIFKTVFENPSKYRVFEIEDSVILGLLKMIISNTSSIICLYENNKTAGSENITRSIFEGSTYLKYILKQHTQDRAKSYFYSNKFKEVKLKNSLLDTGETGKSIRKFMNKDLTDIDKDLQKLNTNYEDEIIANYNKYNGKKKVWYEHNGKQKNFLQLCIALDLEAEYQLLFKIFSDEVHATSAAKQFKISTVKEIEGMGLIEFNERDQDLVIQFCATTIRESVRNVLNWYGLSQAVKRFDRKLKFQYQAGKIFRGK